MSTLNHDHQWLLSFYRTSEISGALFFGRLARTLKPGPIQYDLSKHFSDESLHAWYWTNCIEQLGFQPLKLDRAYQDRYLNAVGIPTNLMEVLAITQVFEKRVIAQYTCHLQIPHLQSEVQQTLFKILEDEKWHIEWVGRALKVMEPEYGDCLQATLKRFQQADREIYQETRREYEERITALTSFRANELAS